MSSNDMINGVSGDTEYLTNIGWKRISNFDPDDSIVEWLSESATRFNKSPKFIQSKIKQPIIHYENKAGLDLAVTIDQELVGFTERGNRLDKAISPDNVGRVRSISSFTTPSSSEVPLSDEDLLLYVACCADGSVLKRKGNPDKLVIRIKKDRKKMRIVKLLEDSGRDYTRRSCKPDGFEVFVFNPPCLTKDMSVFWQCSDRQLKLIYDEIPYWDGCFAKGLTPSGEDRKYKAPMFFSSIREEADLVQYVFTTAVNRRASICTLDRIGKVHSDKPEYTYKSLEHTVRSTNLKYSSSRKCESSVGDPEIVYNIEIPYWVARYNGSIYIAKGL